MKIVESLGRYCYECDAMKIYIVIKFEVVMTEVRRNTNNS